jgi:X box-binding protein 1
LSRKLKNRVAAQTSRDRKKAKMDDMDLTIQQQADKITALEAKCNRLAQEKTAIATKYEDLEHRFEELKQQFEAQSKTTAAGATKVTVETRSIGSSTNELYGSAASNCNPLPKGTNPLELQSILRASRTTKDTDMAASLMKIIALCLLYKTCSKTSTLESWKSLPKVYSQMSPQSWKMVLEKAAHRMPRMAAPQSDCLNQWWGPQQSSWNPAKISVGH